MLTLHPNILEKNGMKEFVVLPFEEFKEVQKELQNFEDLKDLRDAKITEKDALSLSLSEAKNEWNLN